MTIFLKPCSLFQSYPCNILFYLFTLFFKPIYSLKTLQAHFPLNVWLILWYTHVILFGISKLPLETLLSQKLRNWRCFIRYCKQSFFLHTYIHIFIYTHIYKYKHTYKLTNNKFCFLLSDQNDQSSKLNWIPGCHRAHIVKLMLYVFAFVVRSKEYFFFDWIFTAWGLPQWGFYCAFLLSADFSNALYLVYSLLLLSCKLTL